jgi:ureidoglycolate hydrolase
VWSSPVFFIVNPETHAPRNWDCPLFISNGLLPLHYSNNRWHNHIVVTIW